MRSVDLAIIGAGTAGLNAAATAAAHGMSVLVFEHLAPGGQVATVEMIRNFPGFAEGIGGHELGPILLQQAEDAGADFLFDSVERIEPEGRGFVVTGAEHVVRAQAILLAMGSSRKSLHVRGEREFEGRGVSHCASCDGQFFRGGRVVVAGGGDSAFDEAEILAEYADLVTILHRNAMPVAQPKIVERVSARTNVRIRGDATIVAIEGGAAMDQVIVAGPDGEWTETASGLFVYVGLQPNSAIVADLVETDERGAIIANDRFQTSRAGIFVAGDLRSGATALLSSVVGDGAAAATAALRYIRETACSPAFAA